MTLKNLKIVFLATVTSLSGFGYSVFAEEAKLETLVEAARQEPPLLVYDSTGKIVAMAENFAATYGVKATGTKMRASEQLEMVIREVQARNVKAGVAMITDVPAAMAQLIPGKFAESWLPEDLAGAIRSEAHSPLLVVYSPNLFVYNTELYDTCPITNIWQLAEPEWKGRVAIEDPLRMSIYTDWFNQMRSHANDKLTTAYQNHYGKKLETEFDSAAEAFVAALATNGPLITDTDTAAAEAVAAPGQTEPFVALVSAAKFRDNALHGFNLGLCTGLDPFIGFTNGTTALITRDTPSPNAAKLFVRYVMTADGIAPQVEDGKISANTTVSLRPDEPSGIAAHIDALLPYNTATGVEDWDTRQEWQDFWTVHYKR